MIRYLFAVLLLCQLTSNASAQLLRSRSRVVVQAAPVCTSAGCNIAAPVIAQPIVAPQVVQSHFAQPSVAQLIGVPVPVQYSQPVAAQGNTVYGYQALTNLQSQVDLGALYNQAARLTDQAQQLAGQAATDFQGLVQAESQSRADVARIIAQGQAAKEALQAVNVPQRTIEQKVFSFRVIASSDGSVKVEEVPNVPDFDLLSSKQSAPLDVSKILVEKCVNCHNSNKSMGGLNLVAPITVNQRKEILERVTTNDPTLLMPRSADNKPGPRLSQPEINALIQAMKVE